jgi:MFS family permease
MLADVAPEETMSAFKPSPQMRRMQIVALLLLVASGIVNYLDRSALSIANIEVRQELGLSATVMGVLLSAFLMSYAFSQLPAGILVDRVGPRILLGVGLVIWSVAQGAAGFVTSYAQFFAARIGLGIGESPQFPTGARVVSNWFHVKERGFPTGIFNSAPSIGTAIAPPVLTWLMLAYGWRIMFIVMGVVGLIVAIAWFVFYRDADQYGTAEDRDYIRSGDTARTSSPVGLKQWGRLFRCRTTWGMILGNFGGGYLTWVYYAWLPGFLEIQHHMSIARTGIFAAIPPVFGIIGSLFGGYSSDRLAAHGFTPLNSRKIPIICGLLGTAALTIATAYATSETAVMSYVSLAYLLSGIASASIWAIVTAAAPPDYIASSGSIQNFGGYLGGTCSPIVTGIIVDVTGSFVLALLIGAGMAVMGALFYLLLVTRPISGAELEDQPGITPRAVAG